MELILWRHAEAEDSAPGGDLDRALTRRGRKQAERMAQWLRPLVDANWRILSSPAKRALETVKPLDLPYEEEEALAPGTSADAVLKAAGWPKGSAPVIVVGHQPTLGQVAAAILGERHGDFSIRKGAIWWFATRNRAASGEVLIKAVLDPDLLPR